MKTEVDRLRYERRAWANGIVRLAGVDEVGRGSLVGAVVAAAVVWPKGCRIRGVRDSKQLSAAQREAAFEKITRALPWALGTVGPRAIEALNIKQASRLAMRRAVLALQERPEHLLIDAESIGLDIPEEAIIRGDDLCRSIAAASIVAKVSRDRMCLAWHARYPDYGFARHKGYATREHVRALLERGPCPLHRQTFLGKILSAPRAPAAEFNTDG